MTTKTIAKTAKNTNLKSTKATTTKATRKNAPVAKPTAKESKPAGKKLSQIETAIQILGKSKDPMNPILTIVPPKKGPKQQDVVWSDVTQGSRSSVCYVVTVCEVLPVRISVSLISLEASSKLPSIRGIWTCSVCTA